MLAHDVCPLLLLFRSGGHAFILDLHSAFIGGDLFFEQSLFASLFLSVALKFVDEESIIEVLDTHVGNIVWHLWIVTRCKLLLVLSGKHVVASGVTNDCIPRLFSDCKNPPWSITLCG